MDWSSILIDWMAQYGYVAVLVILILCGIGLPIPEELTFILAGYTVHKCNLSVEIMISFAMVGLLAGDSLLFMLGKYYGQHLLTRWPFKRFFTPQRMADSVEFFHKWGHWTILAAGFVAGVRACTYFLAASMGVKYRRFILLDLARAVITCPISIWLGWKFGPDAEKIIHRYSFPVIILILVITLICVLRWYLSKKKTLIDPAQPKSETPISK